jgi:hypothetical protein
MKIRLRTDYSVEAFQAYHWASLRVTLATFSLNAIMHRSFEYAVGTVRISQFRSDEREVVFYVRTYGSPYRETNTPSVELQAQSGMEIVLNLEEATHEGI